MNERFYKSEPVAELGIMLGNSRDIPGDYEFLLSNGMVRPRRVINKVQVHPPDGFANYVWKRKVVHHAELAIPSVFPYGELRLLDTESSVNSISLPSQPIDLVQSPDVPIRSSQVASIISSNDVAVPVAASFPITVSTPSTPISQSSTRLSYDPFINRMVESGSSVHSVSSSPSIVMSYDPFINQMVSVPSSAPVVLAPVLPPLVTETAPSVSPLRSRPNRNVKLPPGFWKGANVAYVPCSTVTAQEPKAAIPRQRQRTFHPVQKRRSQRSPVHVFPYDDDIIIDRAIASNELIQSEDFAANVAMETASFDTRQLDEFTIEELESSCAVSAVALVANVRLPSSSLQPIVSTKCKEIPITKALRLVSTERLRVAADVEITKQQRLECLGRKAYDKRSDLPAGGVVRGHALFKVKPDDRDTMRLAAMGDQLLSDPDISNFSAVTSDGHKQFVLAMMQAHAESIGENLNLSLFDVIGGFLHIKRKSKIRLFLLISENLPHPLAGKYVEILGALYGLRESNRLFSDELKRVISSAGFKACISSPMTFIASDPVASHRKCVISLHVDDGNILDTDPTLTDHVLAAIEKRFGPLTQQRNVASVVYAGYELSKQSNGAILSTQDGLIARAASEIGVSHLPSVDMPCQEDFFKPSVSVGDLKLVNPVIYQSLTGKLIQFLKTRDEVRPFVSHACARNARPNEGDYAKALHILRYLASTPGVGRVFRASAPVLFALADAAFVLHSNGCSAGAYFLSVGYSSAPFLTYARAQRDVAPCQMTSEYFSASNSCKNVMHYRQFASELGFRQNIPTQLALDNRSCINLSTAPEVPRKSRHIPVSYHYIRQLVERGLIRPHYVPSAHMRADILTKFLVRPQFYRGRDGLLNLSSLPGRE